MPRAGRDPRPSRRRWPVVGAGEEWGKRYMAMMLSTPLNADLPDAAKKFVLDPAVLGW
jgi:hypothetical protein